LIEVLQVGEKRLRDFWQKLYRGILLLASSNDWFMAHHKLSALCSFNPLHERTAVVHPPGWIHP